MEDEKNTTTDTPLEVKIEDTAIQELVELIKLEREEKKELEELEKAQEEKLQEELLQDEENISLYQENLLSLQEGETETSSLMLLELQTLNENIVLQNEKLEQQMDLTVEGTFMITLTIAISISIKIFIEQISKW